MNTLGRYTLLQQIGTGSMGTVYRALDPVLEREVALKIIRTSGTVDAEIRERFYREARACARLQHPNIVAVFDLGEVDRVAYIAMELLRGADVRKRIEQRYSLDVPGKIESMIQICEALDHAHRHGVIHRDIKPSNLFLEDNGRAKITDFGIARLPSSKLTMHGNVLGTPNYMAPEQILAGPSDARSDLFSAALVFFEMLVYAHPFKATVIPQRIAEGNPDSLFDYDSSLPLLLEKILNRALSRNPEDRYATGAEFASDLRAVLDGIRLNASPTMSNVILPSARHSLRPESRVDGDPTLVKPAPAGEDEAEWRLSEVLRLIPDFEDAVARRDQPAAHAALEELKATAAVDARFAEAVESCRLSYEKAWESLAMSAAATSGGSTGAVSVPPDTSPNRRALDAVRTGSSAAMARMQALPRIGKFAWHFPAEQKKVLIGSIVACTLLILTGWAVSGWLASVPLASSLGTVSVEAIRASVRKTPQPEGKQLTEVKRGESLRLLELPQERSAGWLHVQATPNGQPVAPGYIAVGDVGAWVDWVVDDAGGAARLALIMVPEDSASDGQLIPYVAKLHTLQTRLTGRPEEQQVRTEAERLEKIIASRRVPVTPEPVVPTPVPEPMVAGPTADELVARGRKALEGYIIERARTYAKRALEIDKNHAGARELLAEIAEFDKIR